MKARRGGIRPAGCCPARRVLMIDTDVFAVMSSYRVVVSSVTELRRKINACCHAHSAVRFISARECRGKREYRHSRGPRSNSKHLDSLEASLAVYAQVYYYLGIGSVHPVSTAGRNTHITLKVREEFMSW